MSYIDAGKKFIVVWGDGYGSAPDKGFRILSGDEFVDNNGFDLSEQMAINALEVGEALTFYSGGTLSVVRLPDEVVVG